ncbi:MAG TPA: gluconokinase [Streptosporangiaceae bacterium]|nr:gluconokinase [Streptosporangiaceae bacterium]
MGRAVTVIVVLAGVSGSGKSTVGPLLAERLNGIFVDGDAFHPAANVAKMHAGVPLTDADREPWLRAIEAWLDQRISAGQTAVVACSALRRGFRDALRAGRPQVRLVLLNISHEAAVARLTARHGHFFPSSLLDTQFRDLEPPAPTEPVLVVDAGQPPAQIVADIAGDLRAPD